MTTNDRTDLEGEISELDTELRNYALSIGHAIHNRIDFEVEDLESAISDLSDRIDDLGDLIDGKSDIGHTHMVEIPDHNHGNPNNQNSGGGNYPTSP